MRWSTLPARRVHTNGERREEPGKRWSSLVTFVDEAARHHRIDSGLSQRIKSLAGEAEAALES